LKGRFPPVYRNTYSSRSLSAAAAIVRRERETHTQRERERERERETERERERKRERAGSCVALLPLLWEWVENQRESKVGVSSADWRSSSSLLCWLTQFMEECYGYERNKMAMVIGVMEEDLGCWLLVWSVQAVTNPLF
jgi:hypothetical protein